MTPPISLADLERRLVAVFPDRLAFVPYTDLLTAFAALPTLLAIVRAARDCPIARGHLIDCASRRASFVDTSRYVETISRACDCGHAALRAALDGVTA